MEYKIEMARTGLVTIFSGEHSFCTIDRASFSSRRGYGDDLCRAGASNATSVSLTYNQTKTDGAHLPDLDRVIWGRVQRGRVRAYGDDGGAGADGARVCVAG